MTNILYLCARPIAAGNDALREVDFTNLDWAELLEKARQHGMMPLLYGHLKKQNLLGQLPESVQESLHRFFVFNALRNEKQEVVLNTVLSLMELVKINVVPVKGLVLAKELYGDTVWRTMDDLDFLVRPFEILATREVLQKNGFTDNLTIKENDLEWYTDIGGDFSMTHVDSGMIVEIGTGVLSLGGGFSLSWREMFTHLHDLGLSSRTVKTLSPELQLLMLCIHGAKHYWERVIWLSDLNALNYTYPDLDFDLVEKKSREMGIWRIVLSSLYLMKLLLGEEKLPGAIEQALLKDPKAQQVAEQLVLRMSQKRTLVSWWYYRFYFHIISLDRSRDKVRYFINLVFLPSRGDRAVIKLPKYMYPLYFIIRPFRLGFSRIRKLVRRLRR